MKIRWQKMAPGVYQTDTGRWRVKRHNPHLWVLVRNDWPVRIVSARCGSLREAKRLVDDQLEREATK